MSKNRGKSKLSKNVLFNANKHVFHCEKSLGTLFYGQPSYKAEVCCSEFGGMLTEALLHSSIMAAAHGEYKQSTDLQRTLRRVQLTDGIPIHGHRD
jgi:hypothetical protein